MSGASWLKNIVYYSYRTVQRFKLLFIRQSLIDDIYLLNALKLKNASIAKCDEET